MADDWEDWEDEGLEPALPGVAAAGKAPSAAAAKVRAGFSNELMLFSFFRIDALEMVSAILTRGGFEQISAWRAKERERNNRKDLFGCDRRRSARFFSFFSSSLNLELFSLSLHNTQRQFNSALRL